MPKTALTHLPAHALTGAMLLALSACGQEPQTSPEEAAAEVAEIREMSTPTEAMPTDDAAPLSNEAADEAVKPPKPKGISTNDRIVNRDSPEKPKPLPTPATTPPPPSDDTHTDPHAGHDMQSMSDHDMSGM